MKITEELFRVKFLEFFKYKKFTDKEFLTEPLNGDKIYYSEEDFIEFLYRFLKDNNLPLEAFAGFPWTKYFKEGLLHIIEQVLRRLLGMKYDKDFFEPEQPFYYETLKNHFFTCLEKLEKKDMQK